MAEDDALLVLIKQLIKDQEELAERIKGLEEALTEENGDGTRRARRARLSLRDILTIISTVSAALAATAVPIILAVVGTR